MPLEMKLALWSFAGIALTVLAMTGAGASQLMIGIVSITSMALWLVILGLGFRAEAKARSEEYLREHEQRIKLHRDKT